MHLDKIFQILQRTESNTNKITLCFMIEDQSITRTIEAKWRKLLNIGIYRSKVEILWSNDKTNGYVIHVDECSQEANSCQAEVIIGTSEQFSDLIYF